MTVFSGEWRLVNGGTLPVGTEKWGLEETSKFIHWSSVIDKATPFPHREELNVTAIPRTWRITVANVRSVGEGGEESFEGKVENETFKATVRRAGNVEQFSIPVSTSMEFDYLSPAFNTITFHRLRLRRGESREIEVLYIFPVSQTNSFETKMVRQKYERFHDESIFVLAGKFPTAKRYHYKNLDSGWTSSIWTDSLEIVLRYEKLCELLSYNKTIENIRRETID